MSFTPISLENLQYVGVELPERGSVRDGHESDALVLGRLVHLALKHYCLTWRENLDS